jgi:integrase
MKIDTENPEDKIKKNRPNLKENTIKQYLTNLNKLKSLFDSKDFDFLNKPMQVKEKISHLHHTSQRNHYNAIIVLLNSLKKEDKDFEKLLEEYGKVRDELNDKYSDEQASGIISDKQKNNFVDISEVNKMIETMGQEIKSLNLKKKKDNISKKEKALLQNYLLFNIYTRIPLRNDVSGMETITKRAYNKLSEEDKKSKNYLVLEKNNMFFVLNKYKTSKKYEELRIDIPSDLKKLLRYYIKVNGMGVLFKSSTGKPLTRNALSQLLIKTSKKYMNKSISTTMLRKIYLSSKYGEMKKELEKDNKIMGHSKEVALDTYVKEKQEE